MLCQLYHMKFTVICSFTIMEISSPSIISSTPSPMFVLESIRIPPSLVLIIVHHLLLLSLAHLVFTCLKHHGAPTNSLLFLHDSQHLHSLLFPTQPTLLVLLLKDHFLLLVSLLVHFHPKLFPRP